MENNNSNKTNVYSIHHHRNYPLFNPDLRQKLETGLTNRVEKPGEAVDVVENILCSYIIAFVRTLAVRLGTKIGDALGEKLSANG